MTLKRRWGDTRITLPFNVPISFFVRMLDEPFNVSNRPSVRVAVAQFEDIVAHGLRALITEDESLDLVADGVPHDELKSALSTHTPTSRSSTSAR